MLPIREDNVKTLLIMRHAKSSWDDPNLDDHERPLNKRGKHDAPRMGDLLRAENLLPDLVLSSTAIRARRTAELVVQSSGYSGEMRLRRDLYEAEADTYLSVLKQLPEDCQRVLLIGHNPGLEHLLGLLCDVWERLPTAALAVVSLPLESWKELQAEPQGALLRIWRPKEVPNQGSLK